MAIHKVVGVILLLSVQKIDLIIRKKFNDLKCNTIIDSVARTHLFFTKISYTSNVDVIIILQDSWNTLPIFSLI